MLAISSTLLILNSFHTLPVLICQSHTSSTHHLMYMLLAGLLLSTVDALRVATPMPQAIVVDSGAESGGVNRRPPLPPLLEEPEVEHVRTPGVFVDSEADDLIFSEMSPMKYAPAPHRHGPIVIVSSYTQFSDLAHGPR